MRNIPSGAQQLAKRQEQARGFNRVIVIPTQCKAGRHQQLQQRTLKTRERLTAKLAIWTARNLSPTGRAIVLDVKAKRAFQVWAHSWKQINYTVALAMQAAA